MAVKILLVGGVCNLLLMAAVFLRRGLRAWWFVLWDEHKLRWSQRVRELLSGEKTLEDYRPPRKRSDRLALEEALLHFFRKADDRQKAFLQEVFRRLELLSWHEARLRHSGKWEQCRSAFVLGSMRLAEASPALLRLLQSADPDVRIAATRALGELRDPQAIEPLFEYLRTAAVSSRRPVTSALIACARHSPQRIVAFLFDAQESVRQVAAAVLAEVVTLSELAPLNAAASSPDPEVRAKVARALGRIAEPYAFDSLKKLAADPAWFVRLQALTSLPAVPHPEVEQVLLPAVRDGDWRVRQRAAASLYRLGHDVPTLLQGVHAMQDRYAFDSLISVLEREGIIWGAVEGLGGPESASREHSKRLLRTLLLCGRTQTLLYAAEFHSNQQISAELKKLLLEYGPDDAVGPEAAGHVNAGASRLRKGMN